MQESALWLLKKRAMDKAWDNFMGPYWDSLPEQGTLNTKETYPDAILGLLQDDSMVHHDHPYHDIIMPRTALYVQGVLFSKEWNGAWRLGT